MSDQIPQLLAEVLEEAAKAAYHSDPHANPGGWEQETEAFRDLYRADVRAAYPVIAPWVTAEVSANPRDEYHTMAELYDYRMLYNALAVNAMPDRAVKSWRHSDGEPCFGGGWFVVYLDLPTGQVSNHYRAEHWAMFRVAEVETAPTWDGHTPAMAADRMRRFLAEESKL